MKGLIDIHAHILPGVDDGASDFQESVRMLKSAYRQGVRCVIATPHYHRNHFHRNPERTMEALQKIRGWLREHLPDMIVLLGTEIYYTIDFAEEITAGNGKEQISACRILAAGRLCVYPQCGARSGQQRILSDHRTCRAVSCLPPKCQQSF